ncbi:hypothetical protein [Bradyrhizobium sp.]|nr:hypothetical protein [Bradyrhizobium sp.]
MKAIIAAAVCLITLYMVDQECTAGQYTDSVKMMVGQISHSIGI